MSHPSSDLHRAGCIQYFEFTFDLAWKSIQSIAAYYGLEPVKSPREAFKVAFAQAWLETQTPWLSMLESPIVWLMYIILTKLLRCMIACMRIDSLAMTCFWR